MTPYKNGNYSETEMYGDTRADWEKRRKIQSEEYGEKHVRDAYRCCESCETSAINRKDWVIHAHSDGFTAGRADALAEVEELVNRMRDLGQAMPPNAVSMEIQKALAKFTQLKSEPNQKVSDETEAPPKSY